VGSKQAKGVELEKENHSSQEGQADNAQKPEPKHRSLSRILRQISVRSTGDVTIADLRDALGERSFGALLTVFAATNLIPLPPPSSLILGIPPLIITAQMVFGGSHLWLPERLLKWSFSAERFRSITRTLIPRLRYLEKFLKARYWPFGRYSDRVIGLIGVVLSILLILPIPGANWIPAFSMVLLGLALSERDGVLLAIGGILGVTFVCALLTGAQLIITHLGDVVVESIQYINNIF
jgi:hypothetical protein